MTGGSSQRILVTGGQGFIGAWIARRLLARGDAVALLDLEPSNHFLGQILARDEIERLGRYFGDVSDGSSVNDAVRDFAPSAVIHLAGVQVPTCRRDPILGSRVNLRGTLEVFEAARTAGGLPIVYASSAAVVGPIEDYEGRVPDEACHRPRTHYGVFKAAGEGCARVYWHDHGIPSVGLRPYTVYGVGREIGATSGPTKAIKAAMLEREYTIPFSGPTSFDFVEDVAARFVECVDALEDGAFAFNLRGAVTEVESFIDALDEIVPGARSRIRVEGPPLPLAFDLDDSGLRSLLGEIALTPLEDGIRRTVEHFARLREEGLLHDRDLDS